MRACVLLLAFLALIHGQTAQSPSKCPFIASIAHGKVTYTTELINRIGGWYNVSCFSGFRLKNNEVRFRKCMPNGEWGGDQIECINNRCPNILGLQFGKSGVQRMAGRMATYKCLRGYQMVSPQQRNIRCNKNTKKWEKRPPKCIPFRCPYVIKIANGKLKSRFTNVFGRVIRYRCDPGYALSGPAYSRCRPGLRWGPPVPTCRCVNPSSPQCSIRRCPHIVGVPNSKRPRVVSGDGTREGSVLLMTCERGYRLTGNPRVTCTAARWSQLPSCIDNHCPHVEHVDNGRVDKKDDYAPAAVITITCDKGYRPKGQATITCNPDGKWSAPPICVENLCPDPDNFQDGVIVPYSNFPGDVINYQCDVGFRRVGARSNRCRRDGTWRNTHPMCIATTE